ncbi:MAG: hypothetical protein FJY88_06265, partial [Candidatus Eisenbacteria bacterium]|nr:hypothetical protein [Candidatus Eisenbacteria bacterium]
MGSFYTGKAAYPFAIAFFALCLAVSLAGAGAPGAFRVLGSTPDRVTMNIELGDLDMIPVDADGRACVLPSLAGHPMLMEKGSPQLPVIRKAIIIGDRANVAVRVIDAEYETIRTITVVPSKGHLTRDEDPSRVPFEFGAVYRKGEYFPAEQAILHDPFIMRDYRGVVVELRPVRYDPARGELQIARRMTVEVVSVPGQAKNTLMREGRGRSIDPEFEPIYSNAFSNWGTQGLDYNLLPEPGRCLILAADTYFDQIDALNQWTLQKGIPTVRKRLSEVGANAT